MRKNSLRHSQHFTKSRSSSATIQESFTNGHLKTTAAEVLMSNNRSNDKAFSGLCHACTRNEMQFFSASAICVHWPRQLYTTNKKTNFMAFCPQAKYTDRLAAACQRS
jgi:hypothetical protein